MLPRVSARLSANNANLVARKKILYQKHPKQVLSKVNLVRKNSLAMVDPEAVPSLLDLTQQDFEVNCNTMPNKTVHSLLWYRF